MYEIFKQRAIEAVNGIDLGDIADAQNATGNEKFTLVRQNNGKILFSPGVLPERGKISVFGKNSFVYIASGARLIGSTIRITGEGACILIGPRAKLKAVELLVPEAGGMIAVGADTSWESGSALSQDGKNIIIGNDCMFSNYVVMRTSDSHGIWDNATGRRINDSADVKVGHHVWLGNSSRLNKGTVIGTGTVVGQCAIVSGQVEPDSIYAGIPARKVKSGTHWTRSFLEDKMPDQYRSSTSAREPSAPEDQ